MDKTNESLGHQPQGGLTMSDSIQSISQGNYILQGTVATSAGIVGDGSTQNPLRADETVLYSSTGVRLSAETTLSEPGTNFEKIEFYWGGTPVGTAQYQINEIVRPCPYIAFLHGAGGNNVWQQWGRISANDDFSKIIMDKGKSFNYGAVTATSWANPSVSTGIPDSFYCYKIVGINRINNA